MAYFFLFVLKQRVFIYNIITMKVSKAYKNHLLAFIFGPILKMVEAFFDLLIPIFMKAIIDLQTYRDPINIPNQLTINVAKFIRSLGTWVPNNQPLNDALIGGVCILVMGVVGFALTMITQFIAAITCVKVGTEIRNQLYIHIMSLSKKERERFGSSKINTILNNDTYQVQQGVLLFIRLIVRAPLMLAGALAFSFILNVNIGFVFLALVPIISSIVLIVMVKSGKEYTRVQSKVDDVSQNAYDTLEGNKVIHAFDKKEEENNKFDQPNSAYREQAMNAVRITSLINPLTFAVISLAMILVVAFGGIPMFENPNATAFASTVMAEVQYLGQILFVLVQLSNTILVFTKAGVSRKRIDNIFGIKPSIVDDLNGVEKSINNGDIIYSFKDVSLKYEEDGNDAIRGITFDIKKGESIGFIGGTGSGKSTVISLFNRLNDIDSGTLLYKGVDIKEYRLKTLRNEVGVVNQKATLFNGTIRKNLLVGKSDATEEEMVKALQLSEAYEFVSSYDDGLDHIVSDSGKNYSGGQRQRLSIARTLLKEHEVIILDDSTSALDLLTEKRVRDNIDKTYKGITKVIVSQRISSVMGCDHIYLLDKGTIISHGSHEQLLKTSKVYKEIYESQILKEGTL